MSDPVLRSDSAARLHEGRPFTFRFVYLRVKQVAQALGLSEATIWRFCRLYPDFPKPYRLTPTCTAWRSDEIAAWMNSRQKKEE